MCTCVSPSELAQIQGTASVKQLAAESEQLIRALESHLERQFKLQPGGDALVSLRESVPVLALHMCPESEYGRQLADDDQPQMPNAFAVLAQHSRRLNAFPEIKRVFWLDLLRTMIAIGRMKNVAASLFANPEFPRCVINFSSYEHVGGG